MSDLAWVLDVVLEHTDLKGDCVFIGGSSARGWANTSSDIDAYVLGGPAVEPLTVPADPAASRPQIDVHALSESVLDDLFAKVDWAAVPKGEFVNSITPPEWLLLERLHHAYVLYGETAFGSYRERLDGSAHQHMLVQTHFSHADAFAEDSLGQLEIGDDDSAVISGQTAVLRAVDGLLAARGCFCWAFKWRPRAMREAKPDLITYEEYWRFQTMSDLAESGHRRFALSCIARAKDIMARTDVLDFETSS